MFKSFFKFSTTKIIGVFAIFFFAILTLQSNVKTLAFEEISDNNITITEPQANLHTAGQNIIINSNIEKDLWAAGETITINSTVSRNTILTGKQININAAVGGSSHIAGQNIVLNGTFYDDVVVFGENVQLNNSVIQGDLVIFADTVTFNNTQVNGDFIGEYKNLNGNISGKIIGNNYSNEKKARLEEDFKEKKKGTGVFGKVLKTIYLEIGVLIGLLCLCFFLNKKGRLTIDSINLDKRLLYDFLIGLLLCIVLPIISIFITVLSFPTGFAILGLTTSLIFLSKLFLPIYLANLIINRFKISISVFTLSLVLFILIVLLKYAPIVDWIVALITFIIFNSNLGFLARKSLLILNTFLKPKFSNKIKNEKK
jgi:hypothetical protein